MNAVQDTEKQLRLRLQLLDQVLAHSVETLPRAYPAQACGTKPVEELITEADARQGTGKFTYPASTLLKMLARQLEEVAGDQARTRG